MTQYNTLNIKLSKSQLNKLKSVIKIGTEVILSLSSNMIANSNNETNFPHKLLLTNKQVSRICKAFASGSLANIKFSKTLFSKMIQLVGFVGERIASLGEASLMSGLEGLKELKKIK